MLAWLDGSLYVQPISLQSIFCLHAAALVWHLPLDCNPACAGQGLLQSTRGRPVQLHLPGSLLWSLWERHLHRLRLPSKFLFPLHGIPLFHAMKQLPVQCDNTLHKLNSHTWP